MAGNNALFGTLCGYTKDMFHKFTVDLQKKHGIYFFLFSYLGIGALDCHFVNVGVFM